MALIGAAQARQSSVESVDQVVLADISKIQGLVVKLGPKFVTGPFRMACRVAFDHHAISLACRGTLGQVRAWKLFMMLPRMFLSRPPRGGEVPKLQNSFVIPVSSGERAQLVEANLEFSHFEAQFATRRRRREHKDELSRRADRALRLVQLGELSDKNWKALVRRWAHRRRFRFWVVQRRALFFRDIGCLKQFGKFVQNVFELDEKLFLQCVRSSRRGGTGGL